jgi:murein tripeptide amidase MpaA
MPANNNNPNLDISLTSLVKSVCGNDVPELTLTSKEGAPNKRVIVIMARQHPGEVWASYMVEGIIKSFLNPK